MFEKKKIILTLVLKGQKAIGHHDGRTMQVGLGRREKRGIRAPLIHSRTIVLSAETAKRPGSDYGRQSNGPSRMKMPIS